MVLLGQTQITLLRAAGAVDTVSAFLLVLQVLFLWGRHETYQRIPEKYSEENFRREIPIREHDYFIMSCVFFRTLWRNRTNEKYIHTHTHTHIHNILFITEYIYIYLYTHIFIYFSLVLRGRFVIYRKELSHMTMEASWGTRRASVTVPLWKLAGSRPKKSQGFSSSLKAGKQQQVSVWRLSSRRNLLFFAEKAVFLS